MGCCDVCGEKDKYIIYWYYEALWICLKCLEEETDG
jgi:hypothetical protein